MMELNAASALFSMEGSNRWAVWVTEVFFQNKFRTLFSMLFGVSIYLVGGERQDAGRSALLRRRLFFLGLFGLVHGLALWFGDILLLYAWSGLFMMLARSWSPRKLMTAGLALVVGFSVLSVGGQAAGALFASSGDPAAYAEVVGTHQAAHLATVERVRSGLGAAMIENLKMWGIIQGLSLTMFRPSG